MRIRLEFRCLAGFEFSLNRQSTRNNLKVVVLTASHNSAKVAFILIGSVPVFLRYEYNARAVFIAKRK